MSGPAPSPGGSGQCSFTMAASNKYSSTREIQIGSNGHLIRELVILQGPLPPIQEEWGAATLERLDLTKVQVNNPFEMVEFISKFPLLRELVLPDTPPKQSVPMIQRSAYHPPCSLKYLSYDSSYYDVVFWWMWERMNDKRQLIPWAKIEILHVRNAAWSEVQTVADRTRWSLKVLEVHFAGAYEARCPRLFSF